mmetsp:Transcript_62583/g.116400  ORF Transcript_62583/g.116400 Transcript_62583/m.116400 type:complete len:369 (-) Transcript_62583:210-1316(-)
MIAWADVKRSGLPSLVVLPAFLWMGVCLATVNAVARVLLLFKCAKEYLRIAEFTFAAMHRPFLLLLPWSNTRIYLYGDGIEDLVKEFGTQQSLVVMNHRGNLDWLLGLYLNDCGGGIGASKAIVKKSLLAVPILGFVWWCSDFVCITRDWKSASSALLDGYRRQHVYKEHGAPYVLALFPEGTRITPKKLKEAQEFERENKLPVFEHVLCPRVKGLWSALQGLQLDSVYDITVAEKGGPKSNFVTMARGMPAEFHIHAVRLDPKSIPQDQEACKKWLFERWAKKEELLQKLEKDGNFGSPGLVDVPIRAEVYRTMLGALCFWTLSTFVFVRLCLRYNYMRLLIFSIAGSAGFIVLLFVTIGLVHLKPH